MSDLISRQDAIDALMKCGDYYCGNDEAKRGVSQCIGVIHDLPSAHTQRKIEIYVPTAIRSNTYIKIRICPRCGHVVEEDDECNFCSVCGEDMRGESDGNN